MRSATLKPTTCLLSLFAFGPAHALTTFESCIDIAAEAKRQAEHLLEPQIDWETSTAGQDQRYEIPLSQAEMMKITQGLSFAFARMRAVADRQGVDVSVFGDQNETSQTTILRSLRKDAKGSRMSLAAVLYDQSRELAGRCSDISGKGN